MNIHDATEQAYRNGFSRGFEEGLKAGVKIVADIFYNCLNDTERFAQVAIEKYIETSPK